MEDKKGIVIGIEGPDGAGKDTFIAGLFEYLTQWHAFVLDDSNRGLFFSPDVTYEKVKDIKPGIWEPARQMHSTPARIKFLNIREGSESCAQFMEDIHSGKISDPTEIAKGYLKVHVEYTEKAYQLAGEYDMVIMNRTLMSFECLQLRTMGLLHCRDYFEQLKKNYGQGSMPHIVLLPPKDTILERAATKSVSVLDKVFSERIEAVYEAYSDAVKGMDYKDEVIKGWTNVMLVTGTAFPDYYPVYQLVNNIINNRKQNLEVH